MLYKVAATSNKSLKYMRLAVISMILGLPIFIFQCSKSLEAISKEHEVDVFFEGVKYTVLVDAAIDLSMGQRIFTFEMYDNPDPNLSIHICLKDTSSYSLPKTHCFPLGQHDFGNCLSTILWVNGQEDKMTFSGELTIFECDEVDEKISGEISAEFGEDEEIMVKFLNLPYYSL